MRIIRLMLPVAVLLAILALITVAPAGCNGNTKKPESAGSGNAPKEAPPAPLTQATKASLGKLASTSLKDGQEGLLFEYVRQAGVQGVEYRFGQPTQRYLTYAQDTGGGFAELADQRVYRFQFGIDSKGAAIVMCHVVEAQQGQSPTDQDKAFAGAITDGKTTLAEANAYLAKVANAKATPAAEDPKAIKVPASVWSLPDGTGFIIVDLTKLTPEQMKSIGEEDSGPYQALYWDSTHWRSY